MVASITTALQQWNRLNNMLKVRLNTFPYRIQILLLASYVEVSEERSSVSKRKSLLSGDRTRMKLQLDAFFTRHPKALIQCSVY